MIKLKNENRLLDSICSGLLGTEVGGSWNAMIPPGFGEHRFVSLLLQKLKNSERAPAIAEVAPDTVPGVDQYIRSLHRQWGRTLDLPDLPTAGGASEVFDALLGSLPNDRPVVQVFRRFHKVLDCMDAWVLGKLRDAEQQRRINTFTATPVSLDELKRRWEVSHSLVVSDYGDKHTMIGVELLPVEELNDREEDTEVPPSVFRYAFALTGGFPDVFELVIDRWRGNGSPSLTPRVRADLQRAACDGLARFVNWLDWNRSSTYRDAVIDLHQGFDIETATDILSSHPWRTYILLQSELRPEALGGAAVNAANAMRVATGDSQHIALETEHKATVLYARRQYIDCARILEGFDFREEARPDLALLLQNAKIMSHLYDDGSATEDISWHSVLRETNEAMQMLDRHSARVRDASLLRSRLDELNVLAQDLAAAGSSNDERIVDILCGIRPEKTTNPRAALVLLIAKYQRGNCISGNASSCQEVLAMPEQVFRVWVYWSLGINYYYAPSDLDEAWEDAVRNWPPQHRPLVPSAPGKQFSSLKAFAYLACAEWRRRDGGGTASHCLLDFRELESLFKKLENIRNPSSHSYARIDRKSRRWFFGLLDAWLDNAVANCPESCLRDELASVVEPLPVVERLW